MEEFFLISISHWEDWESKEEEERICQIFLITDGAHTIQVSIPRASNSTRSTSNNIIQ